jgi:NitT/TauT family transport system permease protein
MKAPVSKERLLPLAGIGAVILLWGIAALFYPVHILPSPLEVFKVLASMIKSGLLFKELGVTAYHTFSGWLIAVFVGTLLGFLCGRHEEVDYFFKNIIPLLQMIPGLVLLEIALIWLGLTDIAGIFVISIFILPIIVINVREGVKHVDPNLIEMGRTLGLSEQAITRKIFLPASLPAIISGYRVSLGIAWHMALFAEMILVGKGVGHRIATAGEFFMMDEVFAWGLVMITVMILIEYGPFRMLEIRMQRWKKQSLSK